MGHRDVYEWTARTLEPNWLTGVQVSLRDIYAGQSIQYGEREYGINLVWGGAGSLGNVSVRDASGGDGRPVLFGDPLAIEVDGGGYLRYQERDYGINLVWSPAAVFEWELTGGPAGTPVSPGDAIGLFNQTRGDHMVYGEREYGINLVWWSDLGIFEDYPPLPVPPAFRGPSGEPGQIEISGSAHRVEVAHGGTDNELDWHIFVRLEPDVSTAVVDYLVEHSDEARNAHDGSPLTSPPDLAVMYCEWMVLDGYDDSWFDELFYSADVTRVLWLRRTAWEYSVEAGEKQGSTIASVDATGESGLCVLSVPVRLQGAFVNDKEHDFRVEIHPLDSVAYAIDARGNPLAESPGNEDWPRRELVWRVAAFTNSSAHRINGADYLKKTRTTTWYLPLPSDAYGLPLREVSVDQTFPGFTNYSMQQPGPESVNLDDSRPTPEAQYQEYGVRSEGHAIEPDPRTGDLSLRVTVTMERPRDRWGGMFLADYRVRVRSRFPRPGQVPIDGATVVELKTRDSRSGKRPRGARKD